MLQVINSKDELVNLKATDTGALKVSIEDNQGGQLGLYLFVGFFTDRISFQQGVLAKHAVFCQL